MSEEAGSSSTNPRGGTPVASTNRVIGSTSAAGSGSIGSLHIPTATPAGRLSSLRGGRGGATGLTQASTRGGATKMRFTPKVPAKRIKKDAAPSLLEEARAGAGAGAGAGTGQRPSRGERGERGGARRGRGRGRPEEVIATASGPFSLGPAVLARSRPIATGGSASGAHSSYTGVKTIKEESGTSLSGDDREYYGTVSVDMKFGSASTDSSIPTGIESSSRVKTTSISTEVKPKLETDDDNKDFGVKVFEDSEDAVVYEDGEDIKPKLEGPANDLMPENNIDQLYFFQFPSVMPSFKPKLIPQSHMPSTVSSSSSSPGQASMLSGQDDIDKVEYTEDGLLAIKSEPIDVDHLNLTPDDDDHGSTKPERSDTKLGLASDSNGSTSNVPAGQRAKPKPPATDHGKAVAKEESEESSLQQEGKIGRLLIYKSGKVKMQVGDIIMDVSSGSECSFLQEIVVVDSNDKQAFVMGAVEKRLICVPNLTHLLSGLEAMDI